MIKIVEEGLWLNIDWPLVEESIIFDIGGFCGDWTERTSAKYPGTYYIFEPIKSFYDKIVAKFNDKKNIIPYNFAVSDCDRTISLGVEGDATTECSYKQFAKKELCSAVNINTFLPVKIDVMAINAEGSEFEILGALISSGNISKIDYFQIQFHNFVPDYKNKYAKLCSDLSNTHERIYLWEGVWEVWMRKELL